MSLFFISIQQYYINVQNKAEDCEPTYSCHGDVCRWSHGCYTLIHDNDPEISEMALDSLFFIGCDGKG